ncbi:MAG: Gfo/Idh/MocA family oxidoreductase [Anaerolineae bacterium]|nr:Gfo/Idh/MocA family oxidoreductase [Anaerolineae bacterium]
MTVRVGVIGLGIGQVHLQHYHALPSVRIVAVADVNEALAEATAARYNARPYADGIRMIEEAELDAVSICTPPRTHRTLTEAAAARGLHVLCEKPMAPTLEDGRKMIAACREAGVILAIGFKKRYAPAYEWLKSKEATFGVPLVITVKYQHGPVNKQWFWDEADGGGPLVEAAGHALDLLRYFCGEVSSLYAQTTNFFSTAHSQTVPAEVVAVLRFANGSVAALSAGCVSEWTDNHSERWSLAYDDALAEVEGPLDQPILLRWQLRGDSAEEVHHFLRTEAGGFSGEITDFVRCVEEGKEPRANGLDGLRALQLSLALKESGRTGKVVEIAPDAI